MILWINHKGREGAVAPCIFARPSTINLVVFSQGRSSGKVGNLDRFTFFVYGGSGTFSSHEMSIDECA